MTAGAAGARAVSRWGLALSALVVFALLAVVLARVLVVRLYTTPSASMMPTVASGDVLLANAAAYWRSPPGRGDVVVFQPPVDSGQPWVKRIVGMPGDRIGFHGNALAINGQVVTYQDLGTADAEGPDPASAQTRMLREDLPGRPHLVYEDTGRLLGEGDWTVPPGHYFLLGDNRDNSQDSRLWSLAAPGGQQGTSASFVPAAHISSRVELAWRQGGLVAIH